VVSHPQAWRADTGECLHTFNKHTDYVQAIVAAPLAGKFVSGGLGGEVNIWDLNSAMGATVRSDVV
jgi:WD40 repeat protein